MGVAVEEDGDGLTSGVVDGAGAGVAVTSGALAAGGGVAVKGVEGTAPTELWAGAVPPVLTPLVEALGEFTERSGEAAVRVERLRVTGMGAARAVVVTR